MGHLLVRIVPERGFKPAIRSIGSDCKRLADGRRLPSDRGPSRPGCGRAPGPRRVRPRPRPERTARAARTTRSDRARRGWWSTDRVPRRPARPVSWLREQRRGRRRAVHRDVHIGVHAGQGRRPDRHPWHERDYAVSGERIVFDGRGGPGASSCGDRARNGRTLDILTPARTRDIRRRSLGDRTNEGTATIPPRAGRSCTG